MGATTPREGFFLLLARFCAITEQTTMEKSSLGSWHATGQRHRWLVLDAWLAKHRIWSRFNSFSGSPLFGNFGDQGLTCVDIPIWLLGRLRHSSIFIIANRLCRCPRSQLVTTSASWPEYLMWAMSESRPFRQVSTFTARRRTAAMCYIFKR